MNKKEAFEQKKERLRKEFLEKQAKKISLRLGKNDSNLFRKRTPSEKVSVGNFNQVISIDPKKRILEAEGMIPFEDLVRESLKHDLLPLVVPQLKRISLGGAIAGLGIEASSFKYGLVHEGVLEMEVLLSSGKTVICSPSKKKDLFQALPNSYGTLGYVLRVKLKAIPVKKYVELTHRRFTNASSYFQVLSSLCADKKHDFIDGVIFSKDELYITTGKFVDKAPFLSNYKYMSIYYKSIQEKKKDYLTTSDFIWRWDTDWFWCSKLYYMQNPFLRFLFGKWMLNSKAYWRVKALYEKYAERAVNKAKKIISKATVEPIVQDVCIPIENCPAFLDFFTKEIGITPIWVCPTEGKKQYLLFDMTPKKIYVDFGFWDLVPTTHPQGYYNKKIEAEVEQLKGKKGLYSRSFYAEDKFWKLYNGEKYKRVKAKYDPKGYFKDLYQKCVGGQ